MFGNVIDLGLTPVRPYEKRKKTLRIIGHYSQTAGNLEIAKVIHNNHINVNGWAGIAYNVVIAEDGRVAFGRGIEYAGGSVNGREPETKGMNETSVAVCFLGDFNNHEMPEAQKQAGIQLFKELRAYYGDIPIVYHKEVSRPGYTDCPGRLFPMDEIRNAAYGTAPQPQPAPEPQARYEFALSQVVRVGKGTKDEIRAIQRTLNDYGYGLSIDGIFGSKTKAAVMDFQQNHGLKVDGIVGEKTCLALNGRWDG